jgi:hypothetical protein
VLSLIHTFRSSLQHALSLRRLLSLHLSLSDNGFQRQTLPFLWVAELSPASATGSQQLNCSTSLNSSALHSQIFLRITSRHGPHRKHWLPSNGLCLQSHYLATGLHATILYRREILLFRPSYFSKFCFNNILPPTSRYSYWFLSFWLSRPRLSKSLL